jgi:CPA2 family monovalent cation:H+ antiporter-2
MLLDPGFLIAHAGPVLLVSAAVLIGKTVITAAIVSLLGLPIRIAAMVGLYLAQIGEFSLVLLTAARATGSLPVVFDQIVLSVTLVSIVAATFMAAVADRVGRSQANIRLATPELVDMSGHTVIIGYGLNGQNVAAALRTRGMPYVILEMNPRVVRTARGNGEPIYYGDAVSEVVLRSLGIERAQCVVFAISDPVATRLGVATARRINNATYIIARTRYISEIEQLYDAGADTVVAEEFETSLEIIRRILGRFGYRPATIDRQVLSLRQGRYEMFRGGPIEKVPIHTEVRFDPFEVEVRSRADGKSLTELGIRENSGATIVAARRGTNVIPNPPSDHVLCAGDHVYLIGTEEEIRRAMRLL